MSRRRKAKKKNINIEEKFNILQGLRSGYDLLKSQNDGTDQTTEKKWEECCNAIR